MKINALLYIEDGLCDTDLTFAGTYLPELLKKRLDTGNMFGAVLYSVPSDYSGNLAAKATIKRENNDDVSFWKKIFAESDADHIVKIYCDSPFLDMDIIRDMINVHTKYLAEFTYSENIPSGYSCEIISKELIEAIPAQEQKTLPLGQVIKSNINKFDVELYYKGPDIRDKRLAFRSGDPRERLILENIFAANGTPGYPGIKEIIEKDPGVLYVSPSYVEIELTGKCQLDCLFCYRKTLKEEHKDIKIDNCRKILSDMKSYGLPYSVCFGGSGEPLIHGNFYEILDLARNESLIRNIVIETNGILANDNFKNYLVNTKDKRIKIIFNINGSDEATYKEIHGADFFEEVHKNIVAIKNAYPINDSIYIQIMKINETEHFLDKYYDFWEKYKIPIILQKQNTFLGRIKNRNYSDLSPLERTPCWHLQRDFNILSDGRVIFCKQDIDGLQCRGDLNEESIAQIFTRSKNSFLSDYKKDYLAVPDCRSCDEWYTFNL